MDSIPTGANYNETFVKLLLLQNSRNGRFDLFAKSQVISSRVQNQYQMDKNVFIFIIGSCFSDAAVCFLPCCMGVFPNTLDSHGDVLLL